LWRPCSTQNYDARLLLLTIANKFLHQKKERERERDGIPEIAGGCVSPDKKQISISSFALLFLAA
jgi:hypothetical protein